MSRAAEAWKELAAQLYDIAESHRSVAVVESVASYMEWLNAVAARAQQTALQAKASVDAFETALAAVVPPSVIDANRAHRTSLAASNFLAQNSPAIADTDIAYERIWAQHADAMYTYAAASEAASTLTPFDSLPTEGSGQQDAVAQASGTWSLIAAPQTVSAGCRVMPVIPRALRALALSPITTLDACLSTVTSPLSKLGSLTAPTDFAINHLNSLNKSASLSRATAMLSHPSHLGGATPPVTARLGRGAAIGTLSVPQSWTTAAAPSRIEPEPVDGDYPVIDPSNLRW